MILFARSFLLRILKNMQKRETVIIDLDTLVPKDHLLRRIERVMDYDWLYEQLAPLYCHDNGRPGTDPWFSSRWW